MELFTPWHLFIVAVVALVLFFGWKQLPDMARSVGRSLRVFKTEIKGMSGDDDARKQAEDERAQSDRSETAAIEAPRAQTVPRAEATPRVTTHKPQANGAAPRPRPAPRPNNAHAGSDRGAR